MSFEMLASDFRPRDYKQTPQFRLVRLAASTAAASGAALASRRFVHAHSEVALSAVAPAERLDQHCAGQ